MKMEKQKVFSYLKNNILTYLEQNHFIFTTSNYVSCIYQSVLLRVPIHLIYFLIVF